jgi:DNA (cytosine-5)-methyltransferase 1
MPRYSEYLNPDFFSIENVREFMDYGPLNEANHPIKECKGDYYKEWVSHMQSLNNGYAFDWKILNAADYGAYTTRKRYFSIFSKNIEDIAWAEITHFKGNNYKPVKDILELENKGKSIFNRKKPYVDATLNRILNGLKANKDEFLVSYYSNGKNHYSTNIPAITVTTKDRLSLITPFILRDYTKGYLSKIEEPSGTLLTIPKINLVTPTFLLNPQWGNDTGKSIEKPCFTLIARMDKAPPLLVSSSVGYEKIPYKPDYTSKMRELVDYMNDNYIVDIFIRPLVIKELLQIQGFPKDYKLVGTQTEQKKFIGNSVETTVMHKWIEAIINKIEYNENRINN